MPIWSVWLSAAEGPESADWAGGGDTDNGDLVSVRLLSPVEAVLGLLVVLELVAVCIEEAVMVPPVLDSV
jgi:hypothetical protein